MKRTFLFMLLVSLTSVQQAGAQFSAYSSLSTGFNANPLCNYEREPDQVRQAYMELKHATQYQLSRLDLQYIGGLTMFNSLQGRNYYEHAFSGQYLLQFNQEVEVTAADSGDSEGTTDEDASETSDNAETIDKEEQTDVEPVTMSPQDSSTTSLETRLVVSARHDKAAFREFDNFGADLQGVFRIALLQKFSLRIIGTTGVRNYVSLQELSNLSGVVRVMVGNLESQFLDVRLHAGGGIKHYLQSVYDTAKFEPQRSYVQKPAGKGKPGAKVTVPSDKIILTNPGSISSGQIMTGIDAGMSWTGGSVQTEFMYRNNLGSSSRLLAQYVNSSFLTDDIYNDFFSYEGTELALHVQQNLLFGIEAILSCSAMEKKFNAPSFNLTGDQTHDHRADTRLEMEFWIQKFIDLSDHSGMGLFLACSLTRNQSNDDYNDFSGWSILGGVSIGIF